MVDTVIQEEIGVRRTRKRKDSLNLDKAAIVDRVLKFYQEDTSDRQGEVDLRLQRYAKLRMWTAGKKFPWEEATDAALPDIMTHSLRVQDTLHNAVMTMRPIISATPIDGKPSDGRQEKIDKLIDYQVFVENDGENIVGEAAKNFVNDGVLMFYVPWVKEDRDIFDIRIFDPIPQNVLPIAYFKEILVDQYPEGDLYKKDEDGWEWEIDSGETTKASFYTKENGDVELVLRLKKTVFDGPCPMVLDWEDIIKPARSRNLQIPGPSNPHGSPHVIKQDFPFLDEITRLIDSGFYDLVTDDEKQKLSGVPSSSQTSENQEQKQQKANIAGTNPTPQTNVESHKPVTRLMCFDCYDIDGDGLDEDVIFWVLKEPKILLRAKMLSEMFPADPPRRPFAETEFLPDGISLPELLEGTHDLMKQFTDQGGDAGTLANAPFGFYDPASPMKQEVIRIGPGELYPQPRPQETIYFPNMPGQSQAFTLNMLTMFGGFQDKLAMQGDLQFGRVPRGQASALRTAGGQQLLLGQGEARPERILRRFFIGFCEVWAQIHELNQRFLPKNKKFRIMGYSQKDQDPYTEIKSTQEIIGRYQFDFKANALNSSKQALQAALMQLLPLYMNPLAVQLGMVSPDKAYQFYADLWKSFGQDPERHLQAPSPDSSLPPILAEEAITSILNHDMPYGRPLEGAQGHLAKLVEFMQSDNFGLLDPSALKLFQEYAMMIREKAVMEARQMQMAMLAQQFAQQTGGPSQMMAPDTSQAPLQNNELIDETLPTAGGGGNPTPQ